MRSTSFYNIKIGEYFKAYGDLHSNYFNSRMCLYKKDSKNTAVEIKDNKETKKVMMFSGDIVYKEK